jgi:hypothetical protein
MMVGGLLLRRGKFHFADSPPAEVSRVTHIHRQDKRLHNGPNVPWGKATTPIVETLRLMQKQKWAFPDVIEMEHPTPPGSDLMTELGATLRPFRESKRASGGTSRFTGCPTP